MKLRRREFLGTLLAATCAGRVGAAADADDWNRELKAHRIADLQIRTVQMKWPRQVGKNARLDVHGYGPRVTICRLTTDKGAQGWGTYRGDRSKAEALGDRLKDRPVTDLFDPGVGVAQQEALPLDFALHDLAGKILKLPVYKLLGGAGPTSSPCYSGMIYFDDLEPPDKPAGIEKVLQNCRDDFERGYRQLKVKIGRGNRWMEAAAGLQRDIAVTQAIARELPDVEILVDGNNGFTSETIVAYLEGIGDVKLFWIEEPYHENVEGYTRLRSWLNEHNRNTLLADGEADPDFEILNRMIARKLLDVQIVDIVGYGFTPWRKLMPQLKQTGTQASPHAWGDVLKTYYTGHLAAGLGNVVTIEGVTCACDDVDFGDYTLKDGRLHVPDSPGFGLTLRNT